MSGRDLAGGNPGELGTQSLHFNPDIEMDVEGHGCTASTCHGGTQTPVLKNGDTANNYAAFSSRANMGENSPVLAHLLAGAMPQHGGGVIFASKQDPLYVRWLAWITQGDPL